MKKQAVKLCLFFAILGVSFHLNAAPRIPEKLLAKSLVYCTNSLGFSFDPQKADVGTNMNVVTEQIYDKLVEFDSQNNRLKPALAKSYKVSDDGLEITFYLRKKVQFHTTNWFNPSRDFNAEDVLFSLNRVMGRTADLPELNNLDTPKYRKKNYNNDVFQTKARRTHFPYFESINLKSKISSITAPSKYVVKITLTEPDASLLAHLASQYAVILSKEYALQLSADNNLAQLDTLPVGTGVYQLKNYVHNNYVRLQKNENYWGKKANIENVVIDFSTSSTGRMAKFLNKECDISAFPEPSQLSSILDGDIINTEGANLSFLAFNFQSEKMNDITLRQTIVNAIDRDRLNRQLFYGTARVTNNILPAALFSDKLVEQRERNTNYSDFAKNEKNMTASLKLWVLDEKHVYNLHPLKMAELIKYDLAKVGISVDIRQVNRAFLVQQLDNRTADYDMILTGWLANNYDPDNFLSAILGCRSQFSITNLANWCDTELDSLLLQARTNEDSKQRAKLYQVIEKRLREVLPILPLVNVNRVLVVSDRVKNVKITPFGRVNLSQLELVLSKQK
ncbi:peptide ABC transporter substrate-binding protein [Phocoenobacter uteri]|nr:ABC transporter substrate-binding protein [Phocoenobacter uteri]MDG6882684.1 peptide ABC transporter substrate-binding protein [Phocoenobacter uteri]